MADDHRSTSNGVDSNSVHQFDHVGYLGFSIHEDSDRVQADVTSEFVFSSECPVGTIASAENGSEPVDRALRGVDFEVAVSKT